MQSGGAIGARLGVGGFDKHFYGADDFVSGVANWGDVHANGNAVTTLVMEEDFAVVRDAVLDGGGERAPAETELGAGIVDVVEDVVLAVVADDFFGGVPGDAMGGTVPIEDAALGVDEIDAFVEIVEELFEKEGAGHERVNCADVG